MRASLRSWSRSSWPLRDAPRYGRACLTTTSPPPARSSARNTPPLALCRMAWRTTNRSASSTASGAAVRAGACPDGNGHTAHGGGAYQALRSSLARVPSGAVSSEAYVPSLSSRLAAENTPKR